MLQTKIGLVDMTGTISCELMAAATSALNIQLTRDVAQFWPNHASVSYIPDRNKIPQGVWPIQLVRSLPRDEGGFHQTKHHQPYAKVRITPGNNNWTIDASHEAIEMLIDPSGNRLQLSTAIKVARGKISDGIGQSEFLVEACDPCESVSCSYLIGDIFVSDFITPHFYEPLVLPDVRYSFAGSIKKPREVLPGGYISWIDPTTDHVKQLLVSSDNEPTIRDLGLADTENLRAFVDAKTRAHHLKAKWANSRDDQKHRAILKKFDRIAQLRSRHYI